jgi:putative hemolysin
MGDGRNGTSTTSFISTDLIPTRTVEAGHYRVSFARAPEEIDEVQKLRFEVFNLELGEGLEESFETGRDVDPFDAICHHLLVTDLQTDQIVGCYRMQTADMATANAGFYSSSLFDLSRLPETVVSSSMEVGRACVARSHRSKHVLFLLWKGLALYVAHNNVRYLFGCCSLTSQEPTEGWAVMRYLEAGSHLHPELYVEPTADCRLEAAEPSVEATEEVELPILFRTYLRYGSRVCGPPAIDREFKTIDFFVVLDVETLSPRTHKIFFG